MELVRTAVKGKMLVERSFALNGATVDDHTLVTFYKDTVNLGILGDLPESIPLGFTHAAVSWSLNGLDGISILDKDSEVLHQLIDGKSLKSAGEVSKWRMLSAELEADDSSVKELEQTRYHLVGDVVYDQRWRSHFRIPLSGLIRGINNEADPVSAGLGGIEVGAHGAWALEE